MFQNALVDNECSIVFLVVFGFGVYLHECGNKGSSKYTVLEAVLLTILFLIYLHIITARASFFQFSVKISNLLLNYSLKPKIKILN